MHKKLLDQFLKIVLTAGITLFCCSSVAAAEEAEGLPPAVNVELTTEKPVSDAAAGEIEILPPTEGWPLPFPVVYEEAPKPPNALMLPDSPSYVPALPGLVSGAVMVSDYGKKVPKFDGIIVKGSKKIKGRVVIPPGGLMYLDDTWRGLLPMLGETLSYLGREYYFLDFVQTIRVKKDVELPIGEKIAVGDHFFLYNSAPAHQVPFRNVTVMSGTFHGVDWAWAGLAPAFLHIGEDLWFSNRFNLAYNQGEAVEVTPQKIRFRFLSGTHYDSVLVGGNRVFKDYAAEGKTIPAGAMTVKVKEINAEEGSATIAFLQEGNEVHTQKLGPVISYERLTEDSEARKNLITTKDGVSVNLIPWPEVVKDGAVQIAVYTDVMNLESGQDWPDDADFAFYPMACPIGHYFGAAIVNKKAIILSEENNIASGPGGYFQVVIDEWKDGMASAFHVADAQGNKSVVFHNPEAENIDLLVGKGRAVTGLINYVGRETLSTMYEYLQQQNN